MGPFGGVDFLMVPPTILATLGKMGPDATTGGSRALFAAAAWAKPLNIPCGETPHFDFHMT